MSGTYKTLYAMLKESPSMAGVSLVFGEEFQLAEEYPLPMVTIVPVGGPWNQASDLPGYAKNNDDLMLQDVDNLWMTNESVNLVCWGAVDPNANVAPEDAIQAAVTAALNNADAVEDVRTAVLRALQYQAPNGLKFVPIAGTWKTFQNQMNRYGRAYVLTVAVDITCTTAPPVEATVTRVVVTPEIEV